MSNNRVLLIAVASILLLAAVVRYGAQEAPQTDGTISDFSHAPPAKAEHTTPESTPVANVVSTPTPSTNLALTKDEETKLNLFREVVKSGKDNDKRIDTDLKDLSPALKRALEDEYRRLPREHRNGRGFVAFLIGRSLSDASDVAFLEQVIKEEPCLSFKNCSEKGPMYEEAEEHSTQVTLDYPQIVASRMLKQKLAGSSQELRGPISQALSASRY